MSFKSLQSVVSFVSIALCVAIAPSSSWAASWKGNGADTLWSTAANWDSVPANNSTASLSFREANPPNKTATLDAAYSYTGNIHVGKGSSAASPYIFEAAAAGNGLTIGDDIWLGYYEDGWLWLKSGTYTFTTKSNKAFHIGQGANSAYHNFWLKVGDGSSSATLASTANHSYMHGGSALVADKGTINFGSKNFYMYESSGVYLTNSTLTASYFYAHHTSSVELQDSTLNVSHDLNVANNEGANCVLKGTSSAVHQTGSGTVFNVGNGANSTSVVEKVDGDWDCYYLRLGMGSNAISTFTQNGGTLTMRTEFGIGSGDNSTGTFYLNGGTVTAKYITSHVNAASASLVIDGGTLKANGVDSRGMIEKANLNVTVKNGGATLDTAGYGVVLNTAFNRAADDPATADVDESNAALTVTGGGSATFTAVGNIATLTVDEDTTLRWFDADATVANYALDSLTLGAGSTLALDVDADGCDTFTAAATNLSATAEKKVTFKLIVRAVPETGRAFPLFAMAEADAANYDVVAETPAGATLIVEKGWADGFLTYAISARDYIWGDGSNGGGWTDGAKWSVDGAASAWSDNNKAVFAAAGDVATLDADVTALALDFRANATVDVADGSTAVIATPEVIVASGVSATVNAPISGTSVKVSAASGASATLNATVLGEIVKEGTGSLVLGTNRAERTTLSEGTLTMSGTASLDWGQFVFGTDPAKPVTLRIEDGATLANRPDTWNLGTVANITSTVVKAGGDWTVKNLYQANAAGANASFVQEGGTLTLTGTYDLGKATSAAHASFDIAGGAVEHTGYIHMGANCPATMTVRTGAKYETTAANGYGIIVGGNADSTLNVAGGEVLLVEPVNLALYGAKRSNGTVNITAGGVLACDGIVINKSSSGGAGRVTIDGGTIRAIADNAAFFPNKNNLTVAVGSNGGTIDVNGKSIAFCRPILEDTGSAGGGMAFKGGGIVALAAGNTYTGTTAIEVGTSVHIPSAGAILGEIAVTVPEDAPADGVYTLLAITGEGTFPASVLTGIAAPENATLRLSVDAKSILCIVGDLGFVWIGGASGNLSEASNWLNGMVPQSGASCTIGNALAANLTLGDTFAPASITFPADSGLVTISGERTLSGLTAIVNDSAQHHVLAFPIDASAATPTLSLAETNYLVFSGGIALASMPSVENMRLAGVWNLTGDWNTPPSGTLIKSGSEVNVSGTLKDGYNVVVSANATLRAADATATQGTGNRFLYQNDGTLIVTGEMRDVILSSSSTSYSLGGFFAYGNSAAVTRVGGLVHSGSTKDGHQFRLNNSENSTTNTIVVGAGGLSLRDNLAKNSSCYPYFQVDSGKAVILESSADWSFGANPVSGKDLNLELQGTLIVNTSDYDDPAVARNIRSVGRIGNTNGKLYVKGHGTMTFESRTDTAYVYIQDTATVSVLPGYTTARNINVGATATLEVAGSGSMTPYTSLALADGATLAFNFTERKNAPVLNVSGKTVTVDGTVKVKVSSEDELCPRGGTYALTSGQKFTGKTVELAADAPKWVKGVSVVDGDIVLDVNKSGIIVIIR